MASGCRCAGPNSQHSLLKRANRSVAATTDASFRHHESLPAKSREVMVLRELEQLSYREIASVVGVPVGTVMSRPARQRREHGPQTNAPYTLSVNSSTVPNKAAAIRVLSTLHSRTSPRRNSRSLAGVYGLERGGSRDDQRNVAEQDFLQRRLRRPTMVPRNAVHVGCFNGGWRVWKPHRGGSPASVRRFGSAQIPRAACGTAMSGYIR
jgi:hypothetical protein